MHTSVGPRTTRAAVLMFVAVSAISSVGLMWQAGRRNPSVLLLTAMGIWVLLPFGLLGILFLRASRLAQPARTALYATPVVALAITLIYYSQAPKPAGAPQAFLFVVVPPLSILAIAVAIGVAKWRGRPSEHSTSL